MQQKFSNRDNIFSEKKREMFQEEVLQIVVAQMIMIKEIIQVARVETVRITIIKIVMRIKGRIVIRKWIIKRNKQIKQVPKLNKE